MSKYPVSKIPLILRFHRLMDAFTKSDDERDLADRIRELYNNPDKRKKLSINASKFIEKYNWSHYRKIYLDLLDSLKISSKALPQTDKFSPLIMQLSTGE